MLKDEQVWGAVRRTLSLYTTGLKRERNGVGITDASLHLIKFFNRISGSSNDREFESEPQG